MIPIINKNDYLKNIIPKILLKRQEHHSEITEKHWLNVQFLYRKRVGNQKLHKVKRKIIGKK